MYYRPLPDCLTIKKSTVEGLGVFATEDIPKGTVLGVTHRRLEGHKRWMRTPLGGFYNHSGAMSNCETYEEPWHDEENIENVIGVVKKIRTMNTIYKGQEILVKYTLYNPEKGAK